MKTQETGTRVGRSGAGTRAGRGAGLVLDDYVPYQLAILSSRLSRALESIYGDRYGLARTQWRALALVADGAVCSASDLVERSGLDAVAIHRAVKTLEALGYVTRQGVDHDRRVRLLRVTAAGRQVYEAIVPHALALQDKLLGGLDPGEARAFRQALAKLMSVPLGDAQNSGDEV